MKSLSKWFFFSIILFAAACAPKRVAVPLPDSRGLDAVLGERMPIEHIGATMAVAFEKKDSEMHGDAVLDIAKTGDLHLSVYTLGILGMELVSRNGEVTSNPRLDRTKTTILTEGLRYCLFWWDMEDASVQEDGDFLVMRNTSRAVWLEKGTLLPSKQQIYFEDGRQLMVLYDSPAQQGGIWYQSRMRIEMKRYVVTLLITKVEFSRTN